MKKILCKTAVLFLLSILMSSICVFAETVTNISSVTFDKYIDEAGYEDDALVTVRVNFTVKEGTDQVAVLVVSEDIDEINEETKSKVIYMDQSVTPDGGVYEFAIEKSKIKEATGTENIEGSVQYVKLAGKSDSDTVTQEVTYNEPDNIITPGDVDGDKRVTNRDGTLLLQYLAEWELSNVNIGAMDVDANGTVNQKDATLLLRYLAGWDIELK